ncbi:MAG: hypothetical protein ACREL5_00185 [Gemmatimonadales bacterium]
MLRRWHTITAVIGPAMVLSSASTACASHDMTTSVVPPPSLTPAAVVIDSSRLVLISTPDELADGTYRYSVSGSSPTIASGNVIVGAADGGYLRQVRSVTMAGDVMSVETDPAVLTDAVQDGDFHFSWMTTPSADLHPAPGTVRWGAPKFESLVDGVTIHNGRIDLDNVILLGGRDSGLSIQSGSITFSPTATLDLSIQRSGIKRLEAAVGGSLAYDADLVFGAQGAVSLPIDSLPIATFDQPFVAAIGDWPVYGDLVTTFSMLPTLTLKGAATAQTGVTATGSMQVGALYDGSWHSETGPDGSVTVKPLTVTIGGDLVAKLGLKVESQLLFYRTVGPYMWVEPYLQANGTVDLIHAMWSTSCNAALNAGVGIQIKIFSHSLVDYDYEHDFFPVSPAICSHSGTLVAPGTITVVSGDAQTAPAGATLPNPVAVRVLSLAGAPQQAVPVTFASNDGGGFSPATAFTDASGTASSRWTMPGSPGAASGTATAMGYIGSPVAFTATAANTADCSPQSYALGTVASGALAAGDCTLYFGNESVIGLADLFLTSLAAPATVVVSMNASSFAPRLDFNIVPSGAYNEGFVPNQGDRTMSYKAIVPAGPLYIRPNGNGPGAVGAYSFSVNLAAGDITNCEKAALAANVSASEQLRVTDCTGAGGYYDRYLIAIPPRWTATVTMRSTAFDSYLELTDYYGSLLRSDDDGAGARDARVTYTNPNADDFLIYYVLAKSAVSSATGPYTIDVALAAPAGLREKGGPVRAFVARP